MTDSESKVPKKKLKLDTDDNLYVQFPLEMWTEIFKHLRVEDKKVVKLVCHRWYNACNVKCIADTEKFVFGGLHRTEKILDALANSKCDYFNLEFLSVTFLFPHSFFENFGSKVYSITFIHCHSKITIPMLEQIIKSCTNLTSLLWKAYPNEWRKGGFSNGVSCEPLEHVFQKLVEKNVVRKSLIYLEYSLPISPSGHTSKYLLNIFTVFPSIQTFKISFTVNERSISVFSSSILKLFNNNPSILPKLEFELKSRHSTSEVTFTLPNECFDNIMITSLESDKFDLIRGSHFVNISKNLRSISIFGEFRFEPSHEETLSCYTRVLNYCPLLHFFQMKLPKGFSISREFLEKLILCSTLENLSIANNDYLSLQPNVVTDIALPANDSVRTLCIDYGRYIESDIQNTVETHSNNCIVLLQLFLNLERLFVNGCSCKLLKHITENHTNLKSLSVSIKWWGETEWLKNAAMNKIGFKNLEALSIQCEEQSIAEEIINALDIPNLQYLQIVCYTYKDFVIPSELRSQIPNLVYLFVICESILTEEWLSNIENFKMLRAVEITTRQELPLNEIQCKQMFQMCPQLRFLQHTVKSFNIIMYRNILNDKLRYKVRKDSRPSCKYMLNPSWIRRG